jgi:hypothetical protein
MIAPLDKGLETNVKPWLIADEAYSQLINAYSFRGRIRKRFGSTLLSGSNPLLSQLRIALSGGEGIGMTDGSGNAAGTVPGSIFQRGQLFSIGTFTWQVTTTGLSTMLTASTGAGTYNTTNGAYTFTGAPALTQIYFYPSQPVMAFINYETMQTNYEPTYAWDTQFAYQYNGGWDRLGTALWTGNNSQFFWGYSWRDQTTQPVTNLLYVTNNNPPDAIKYWDGSTWTTITPVIDNAGNTLVTALMIISFKGMLVALNTTERINGDLTYFPYRARWTWEGNPVDPTAWNVDLKEGAGFEDASTQEKIITCEFLKDRVIVYFERSTWELVYQGGNYILPLIWQKINTELGAESTFSVVPFDKIILGIANNGIHACNGANVERIDDKIPDTVFDIHNDNEGVQRVVGIRDYYTELVLWTFPSLEPNATIVFPNQVLVYNYKNGSWAFFDDTITFFGYYQVQTALTWANATMTWESAEFTWDSGQQQAQSYHIIAGNQQGYTFLYEPNVNRNAAALNITNIVITNIQTLTFTVYNHNFYGGQFVYIENLTGSLNLNGDTINQTIVQIAYVLDVNTFQVISSGNYSGTYTGGGTLASVSRIEIKTKEFNFYAKEGKNAAIQKVDFMVDATDFGQIQVNFYDATSPINMTQAGLASGSLQGTGVLETSPYALYPIEASQTRLWHPVYTDAEGEVIQIQLVLNNEQMLNIDVMQSDFTLHAFTVYARGTSSRLQ